MGIDRRYHEFPTLHPYATALSNQGYARNGEHEVIDWDTLGNAGHTMDLATVVQSYTATTYQARDSAKLLLP